MKFSIRILSAFIVASSVFIFSCTKNVEEEIIDTHSLKELSERMERKVKWSQEIDGNLLTKKVEQIDGLASSVKTSVYNYNISRNQKKENPEGPYLETFTFLTLDGYDSSSLSFIKSVAKAVVSRKSLDSYLESNKRYEALVFDYYLERMNEGKKVAFADYLLGKPFVGEKVFECPVRFFYKDGYDKESYESKHVDVIFYLENIGGSYKVSQISFFKPLEEGEI